MANSIRNTIQMDSLFNGFFNSSTSKKIDPSENNKMLDTKPTAESVTLRPGLFLSTSELERKFELNNHLARKSIWNTLFILCTPIYVLTAYWTHFLLGLKSPELVPLCVLSILSFVVTTTMSISILFTTDAETIVYSSSIRRLFGATGFVHFFCYAVIYVLQGYHNTCHPLSVHCNVEEFPVDVFFCLMFVTITMQLGFPSFPWGYALALQLTAGLFVFLSIPLYSSSQQVPVTLLGVLSITGSVLVRRRDAVGYFRLTLRIEEQKEFEQQAKLGDRLRLMISGVAHDLKSPLSALSLGLESIPGIYESIRNIVQTDMSRDERIRLSEDLLETVKDLGYGMDHSRHAMGTIISRCVDINQALNGIPLVPCLQDVEVNTAVDQVVTNYREENEQVRITVTMDPDIGSIESDLFWVQESLSCLVSNAVKFCDYSSDSDTHTVRSDEDSTRQIDVVVTKVARSTQLSLYSRKMNRENEEFVRFEVWDEGIGVDEDMELSLFTFLGHSRQVRVGGAGLGLGSLACRIRTLGGSYGYFSRRKLDCGKLPPVRSTSKRCNQGSIFWFEIPLKISDELRQQWSVVAPSSINTNTHHPGEYASKDVGFALHEAHRSSSVSSTPIFSKGTKLTPTKATTAAAAAAAAAAVPRSTSARVAPDPMSIHSTGSNANSMSSGVMPSQQQVEGIRTIHRRTQEVRSQLMGEMSTSSIPLSSTSSVTSMVNGGGVTPREPHSLLPSRRVPGALEPEPTSISMFFHSTAQTPRFSVRSAHLSTMPSHHNVHNAHPPSTISSNACTEATSVHSCHAFQAPGTVTEEDDEAPKVDSLSSPAPARYPAAKQQTRTPATAVMTPPTSSHVAGDVCDALVSHGSPTGSTTASGSPPSLQQPSCSRIRPDLVVKIHTDTSPVPISIDTANSGVCSGSGATVCALNKATKKLHVLIVDDSMPIRKMCSMILKQHGHSVATAMNGKEALQMMIQACDARIAAVSSSPPGTVPASESIDLVLMDIQMPVMDGLEAVTLYRAHETPLLEKLQQTTSQTEPSPASADAGTPAAGRMKPLLIIGMSACSDVDIIEKGLSVGMDRFVAKPFQIHHLTPILNESFPSTAV